MSEQKKNPVGTILFVDDEDMARKYFERAFRREFNILTANSVDQARRILQTQSDQIGVLITDQRMPGEMGVDLLRTVRNDYPHIVRLLTTAYSDLEDAIAAVNSGEILRYISKPWDLDQLATELRHAMQFYQIQYERDQLLSEKLSVRQRMTAINRARDLIVMAAGFTHCRDSIQAMYSLLSQRPVGTDLLSDSENSEMWGQLEDEIKLFVSFIEKIKTLTFPLDSSSENVDIDQVIKQSLRNHPSVNTSYTTAAAPANATVSKPIISRIFDLLPGLCQQSENDSPINITLSQHDSSIIVEFRTDTTEQTLPSPVSVELVSLFFLVYHIGAELTLLAEDKSGFEFRLPENPQPAADTELEDTWLDQIFSRYEY